jgi:hypothetical protein
MSADVSRLLDDLYAAPALPETQEPTRAPEWSSAEALDEVFASWVPGPGDDAPAAQRSIVAEVRTEPVVTALADDEWLHGTEPVLPDPEPVGVAPVLARWSPSDDDILPSAGRRRRR